MADLPDIEWAKGVLEWWRDHATSALTRTYRTASGRHEQESYASLGPKVDALREREHQTRVVLGRVLGLEKLPVIIDPFSGVEQIVGLGEGIALVKYALGVIATQAETHAHLGGSAPRMAADAMHPTVWDAVSKLWADGHFGQAVRRAATFLNAHVQDLVDRHDVSDATLMQQVFSLSAPEDGKARLRWPGEDSDLTVKAMRSGILNFSQGCFMAIRNPATHTRDEVPRQIALEHLATLSTLARWIDACEVARAPQ